MKLGGDKASEREPFRIYSRFNLFNLQEAFKHRIFRNLTIKIYIFSKRALNFDGDITNTSISVCLVSNSAYTPERGDIIVFHMTGEGKFNEPLVKRVIATGGEWIDIDFETWKVRIADNPEMENAITLEEHYIHIDGYTLRSDFTFPLQVPEGYLFVLGDNRNGSSDSRSAKCGLVDERRVLGKVLMRV